MNHRPKYTHKTIKLLKDNVGENLDHLGYGNNFFRFSSIGIIYKRDKIDKLDFIKIKNFYSVRTMSREEKSRRFPKTDRKHLQKTHLIKYIYPKYKKNF